MATSSIHPASHKPVSTTRNKILFILAAVLVLGIGGLFARLTMQALYVRSVTSSVFNNYVIEHKIGTAEVSDDASGFQGDFCVLHLRKAIPQSKLEQTTLDLMYQYYNLDGGSTLSIRYNEPGTGKSVTEADVYYNQGTRIVMITLNEGTQKKAVNRHVDWEPVGDGS